MEYMLKTKFGENYSNGILQSLLGRRGKNLEAS